MAQIDSSKPAKSTSSTVSIAIEVLRPMLVLVMMLGGMIIMLVKALKGVLACRQIGGHRDAHIIIMCAN